MTTSKSFPKYVYSASGSHYVADQDALDALDVGQTYESPADVPEEGDPEVKANQDAEKAAQQSGSNHDIPQQPEYSKPGPGEPENVRQEPEILGDGHTERDRLEVEAKTIGLKTNRNWTDETLRRKILEHGSK